MFTEFSVDIKKQLSGLFAYIKARPSCINGLKKKDFRKFAGCYNGNGMY